MRLACVHCGKPFWITAEQLGSRGRCPHCQAAIQLPSATDPGVDVAVRPDWREWTKDSISFLASLIFHTCLFLVLALASSGSRGGVGLGEEVMIGNLPGEVLTNETADDLSAAELIQTSSTMAATEELEITPPVVSNQGPGEESLEVRLPSSIPDAGGGLTAGTTRMGGSSMGGGSWEGMVQSLRRNGLDIVIAFDSTGSMGGEIQQVKHQIRRIGTALSRLIPRTRISICTYRDQGDEYVVKGLPLTDDLQQVEEFLRGITADGGGDYAEAVQDGLNWSVEKNQFRPRARKVILLFGDAPPHREHLQECLKTARGFRGQQGGVVSTVTCRSAEEITEFYQIADAGGGEAFRTTDERQIMTQLVVLVFGSQHREKVLEAFELLKK